MYLNIRKQQGAFLVMMVLMIAVLLGAGALALDIGRVLVLKAEMQHAADAAALAAAAELDQQDGAITRAREAARVAIEESSHFATVSTLLGETGLPDNAFNFFCVVGSSTDIAQDADGFTDFCSGSIDPDDSNKVTASLDSEAHYVEVRLDEAISNSGQFTTELIFLPFLKILNIDAAESVSLKARAVAGRGFYACNYPPMAICDPFEGSGSNFRDSMTLGGHIELKQQGGNQWSNGNFGFLTPYSGGTGASDVSLFLADEGKTSCTPPIVSTEPGGMTQKMKSAINTRFDVYESPSPFNRPDAPDNWPPAPAISEYPLDQNTLLADGRFGQGDWDFASYKQQLVDAGIPTGSMPSSWSTSTPTRWEVYNWEIESGNILQKPDPSHLHTGEYPPAISNAERRLLYVAVISCQATGLTGGRKTTPIFGHDGFAKMFLIKKAEGPPNATIFAEYIGWGNESDGKIHVDIQLYE